MLQLTTGNMFEINADVLINTVNCVGVMGCGVALAFKNRYPNMFRSYRRICNSKTNNLLPGTIHEYKTKDGPTILNLATKDDWINPSEYSYILTGLIGLKNWLFKCNHGIIVALPALGWGHGGLDWNVVWKMIQDQLGDLNHITIYVFQPQDSRQIGKT